MATILSRRWLCRLSAMLVLAGGCGDADPAIQNINDAVSRIDITPLGGSVAVGSSIQLTATPRDTRGNALGGRTITWTSSDSRIATVVGGVVTGVGQGSAAITAASEGKTATANVAVGIPGNAGLHASFVTYAGGSGDSDMVRDVATDAHGNVYLAGGTNSADFLVTPGAFDVTFNNPGTTVQDVFVQKRSPSGQIIWSTFIGGTGYDRAYAIEVDAQGFVYVAGRAGTGFPVTAGALQTTFRGGSNGDIYGQQDGFVCKLTPDGAAVVFCTYFGTDEAVPVRDIALDVSGNIYIATSSDRVGFPAAWFATAYQKTPAGSRDMLIAKLNSDGRQILWATYVGGSGGELNTNSIRVDGSNNVYAMTTTRSGDAPTPNGFDHSLGGESDVYLTKFSPDGSQLLYGTYIGGSAGDFTETHQLWVTPQGEAIVGGVTTSTDLPVTAGAFQQSLQGIGTTGGTGGGGNYSGDGMVVKVSPDGSRILAATYLGGRFGDGVEGVSTNAAGEIYVSGTSFSNNFPVTDSTHAAGNSDLFVAVLTPDLTRLVYATLIGGSGEETCRSSIVDAFGNVYAAGTTASNNLPVLSATQPLRRAGEDGSLVKLERK